MPAMLADLKQKMESYAMEGLRCLALAEVQLHNNRVSEDEFKDSERYRQLESGMTFVGLAMMMDPPRQQVNTSASSSAGRPASESSSSRATTR